MISIGDACEFLTGTSTYEFLTGTCSEDDLSTFFLSLNYCYIFFGEMYVMNECLAGTPFATQQYYTDATCSTAASTASSTTTTSSTTAATMPNCVTWDGCVDPTAEPTEDPSSNPTKDPTRTPTTIDQYDFGCLGRPQYLCVVLLWWLWLCC